jgi:hypothetical protein
VSDLTHLADKFSFSDLQREIATWSLSTLFSSECFLFLAEWGANQPQRARLDQPVFDGYDEPTSREMLILTRGNVSLARTTLDDLRRSLADLSVFSWSIPIHKCEDAATIQHIVDSNTYRPGCPLRFASEGGVVYSLTNVDVGEYSYCLLLICAMLLHWIWSDDFPNCCERVLEFYRSRWTADEAVESGFVMEGASAAGVRKLMRFARGRYCFAWVYFLQFCRVGRMNDLQGMGFSAVVPEQQLVDALRRSAQNRAQATALALLFMGIMPMGNRRTGSGPFVGGQDAREFLQRHPELQR